MERRTFLAWLAGVMTAAWAALTGRVPMRPWIVGASGLETVGSTVGDGMTGRVADPVTGAGLFNPDLDPAVSGIDPLTGALAPTGTDVGFGSAMRRWVHTNVINGDFAVAPPDGVGTPIVSDPSDAGYNPLPGWTFTNTSDAIVTATIETAAGAASGQVLRFVAAANAALNIGDVSQLIPIPRSQGQQFRVLLSCFASVTGSLASLAMTYQYYTADLSSIGSLRYVVLNSTSLERALDAGLVPPTATYIRVAIACGASTGAASADVYEVRAAFVPAEVPVKLAVLTGNSGSITSTETTVIAATIPPNTFVVGATYRLWVYGTATNNTGSNKALTMNCRIGTVSLSGTIVATQAPNIATGNTNVGFTWEVRLVCRSVGATGTVFAVPIITGDSGGPFPSANSVDDITGTSTIDTTATNTLEVTASVAGGTASVNFRLGSIVCENS